MENNELNALLNELDNKPFELDEFEISNKINSVVSDKPSFEQRAEFTAFRFSENYEDVPEYYIPMASFADENGNIVEIPSRSNVDDAMLEYWKSRAKLTKNPIMKARYSGLVWDFAAIPANYEFALMHLESLIQFIYIQNDVETLSQKQKVERAYKVVLSLNDSKLKVRLITSSISLEERISDDNSPGLCGFCFDTFLSSKDKDLTEVQRVTLIKNEEARLSRVSQNLDPWPTKYSGVRLANYYRTTDQQEDVKRVIRVVGKAFENACETADPLLAQSWYEEAHQVYTDYQLKDESQNVANKIIEIGPKVVESMQSFSHSIEISKKDMDAVWDAVNDVDVSTTLTNIAIYFLPRKERLTEQLYSLARKNPLSYMINKTLQDHKGRPITTVGSIENDLSGNLILHLSSTIKINNIFLHAILAKLIEERNLSIKDILDHLQQSPIFEESQIPFLEIGLRAFLNQDDVPAIHLLIPQIEAIIRNLVEVSGGPILKTNRNKQLQLRTLDDLLRDNTVEKCFNEDTVFYFRALLTDARGWSLRNDVCHGTVLYSSLNRFTVERVLHILLCLAMVRKKESV